MDDPRRSGKLYTKTVSLGSDGRRPARVLSSAAHPVVRSGLRASDGAPSTRASQGCCGLRDTPEPSGSALPLYYSASKNPSAPPIQLPIYSLHMCCVCLWRVYLYKFFFAGFIKYPLGVGLGGGDPDAQEEMFHISRSAVCAPRQPLPPAYQM